MDGLKSLKATHYKQLQIVNCKFNILNFSRKGFTLLEIMIALAIIGVAIIAILHTVNYHADVAYEQTITTRMLLMAREKISEMETNPKNDEGIFPESDFSYETIVSDIDDPQYKGIVELKAIVIGYDKEIELSELVIKKPIQNAK